LRTTEHSGLTSRSGLILRKRQILLSEVKPLSVFQKLNVLYRQMQNFIHCLENRTGSHLEDEDTATSFT